MLRTSLLQIAEPSKEDRIPDRFPDGLSAFADELLHRSILQGPTRSGLDQAETALMRFLESAFLGNGKG